MVFPVVTYGCESHIDCKESWTPKNCCFWTVVLKKTVESPLNFKEIQPFHPKGDQPWVFIGRTDAEAETLILWPPDVKNWLWKRPWCWERLKAGGEGEDRGWDGWMTSLTQWTWVLVGSGTWWWTGKPGGCRPCILRVQPNSATELNSTQIFIGFLWKLYICCAKIWVSNQLEAI